MKYTAVISLFLAAVAVAELPYYMPNGKREVLQREPVPEGADYGFHNGHHHHGTGTGGVHPTGTDGGHHSYTGTGGYADPTGESSHTHTRTHAKKVEPYPTTLSTHTKHRPHGTGHGTGAPHGTGWNHGTGGTGGPYKPTETGQWTWPEKPSATAV